MNGLFMIFSSMGHNKKSRANKDRPPYRKGIKCNQRRRWISSGREFRIEFAENKNTWEIRYTTSRGYVFEDCDEKKILSESVVI